MKILSLNCRGLNNSVKRKLYFNKFSEYDLIFIQESYVTKSTVNIWRKQWGGHLHASFGTKNSLGTLILINKKCTSGVLEDITINERCIGVKFEHDDVIYYFFSVYAPSIKGERSAFFNILQGELQKYKENGRVILCGDFNSVIDNTRDVIAGNPHSERESLNFRKFVNGLALTDCWREKHPNEIDFTWHRHTPFTARRLDYIFISNAINNMIGQCTHKIWTATDHKAVILILKSDAFVRGPPRWHFNESLLDDEAFCDQLIKFIPSYYSEIAALGTTDDRIKWDLLKVAIRDECISFSKKKVKHTIKYIDLETRIKQLHDILITEPTNQTALTELKKCTLEKEIIELNKAKGALVRSRANWVEHGEKNSKYFLGLEKHTQSHNIIKNVQTKDGVMLEKPDDILNEIKTFYETLYKDDNNNIDSTVTLNNFIRETEHNKLSQEDKDLCEQQLTIDELKNAVQLLNRGSAPGTDGLTPAFFIRFWEVLELPLYANFVESIAQGELSLSQRRGIISLLHKGKQLSKCDLNNYRPITLTNTDYKIYTKVLALRLQKVIKSIISEEQSGFIKGRTISTHIRLIDDIIKYANNETYTGLIVSLDFFKAFDSVKKDAIIAALKQFNFGTNFQQLVKTMLTNTVTTVKNGGWLSSWFSQEKGVRQGCCVSPLLFIIVIELLSIKIRSEENIKSIIKSATQIMYKVKSIQYADDVTLCIDGTRSLSVALDKIDEFHSFSGLRLNRKKSYALEVGHINDQDEQDKIEGIKWLKNDDKIKILGIYYSGTVEASLIRENWENKVADVKTAIEKWSRRNLSLYGKIIVAKTFLISKICYIIQALALPNLVLEEIDSLIFKFLWKKKTSNTRAYEKLKRKTLCAEINKGGLGMIRIIDQQNVFLIKWMKNVCTSNNDHIINTQSALTNHFLSSLGGLRYICRSTVKAAECPGLPLIASHFWRRAVSTFMDVNSMSNRASATKYDPIFLNNTLRYKGKPLFIQRWLDKGVHSIHHIISNGEVLSIADIEQKIGKYGGIRMDYNAVYNSIINSTLPPLEFVDQNIIETDNFPAELNQDNKTVRNIILESEKVSICGIKFWQRKYNIDITPFFSIVQTASKESRLRLLHFKILHNIYPTNILLHKMKIKETNLCEKCGLVDFIEHVFFQCPNINSFWKMVENNIEQLTREKISITEKMALFGVTGNEVKTNTKNINIINHLLLIGKVCISKVKYGTIKDINIVWSRELELRRKYLK